MTTFIHNKVCECPFCVLEKPEMQLCGVLLTIDTVGMHFAYPKKHAEFAVPKTGRALAQIIDALRTGEKGSKARLTARKRGSSETFRFKNSTLSLECLRDNKAWKICWHTKVFEDEDPI